MAAPAVAPAAAAGTGLLGVAGGAASGFGLSALVAPAANFVGFGVGGVEAGSLAASWMSSIAIGNGIGVTAGSTFATLQSIGAVGIGGPVALGLIAAGAAVGGIYSLSKTSPVAPTSFLVCIAGLPIEVWAIAGAVAGGLVRSSSERSRPKWILVEFRYNEQPCSTLFEEEEQARKEFSKREAAVKILFDPTRTIVDCSYPEESNKGDVDTKRQWILVEVDEPLKVHVFDDEQKAQKAFKDSIAARSTLFDPDKTLIATFPVPQLKNAPE